MNTYNIPVYQPDLSGNEKRYVVECLDSTWISAKGRYRIGPAEIRNYLSSYGSGPVKCELLTRSYRGGDLGSGADRVVPLGVEGVAGEGQSVNGQAVEGP